MTAHPPATSDEYTLAQGGTLALNNENGQVGVRISDGDGAVHRITLHPAGMASLAQHLAQVMAGPAHAPEIAPRIDLSEQNLTVGRGLRLSGTRAVGLRIAITDADGIEGEAELTDAEAQWLAARSMIMTLAAKWKWAP